MTSERVQRQIDRLLDEADDAAVRQDWQVVRNRAEAALAFDPENRDALAYLEAAQRGSDATTASAVRPPAVAAPPASQPTSFANGRYTVTRFLGEGGKKKVYLARDSLLDRDVAFALIKTEGLDEASRLRVQREAQAMGRLGAHPHIVTVFDIGEENGAPYLVLPVLAGGDVEGVIEKAPENKLTIERAVKIALDTCLGLEFAHSKGIVHRDLKPGNVWLTEDGRAMIGDFGLAVAVDKSRLTQAGMMVGTVSYMPPEQAMGGEVGPRSDLYSLGAMLYEMVCGRPPFVGDESVAIIGQHLNTPPVAPSWHRPDCPPALEALILRLLEKDPSKRPASATEVREALESVTTSATSRQATVAQELPAGDNPLYRRTFVGRENELKQVQSAFDAALSGQGGLVMVVGEPGIGKTALCEQLATYVALRGGKALVGHCYEEGSLSLPYLAFVEAMRSYVLVREPDGLRSDLGTGAADVARIVSEVRDRVQGVELRPAGDPEDDRWRLLQAITSFLRNASTVQPLCIVLEDLHWADRGTLDLLQHVARSLQGSRLLVVGTFRDVEVDRTHPLSGALGDLRRIANFARIPLRGLTAEEVQRMMAGVAQREIPWPFAELLHRQTEGNPLFVQEMLRYLVEEGLVAEQSGALARVGDDPLAGRIPEGLRDVIGRRLSRLSAECNRQLAIASVIGRDFRFDTLGAVAGISEDDLVNALEEATRIGVVEEQTRAGVITYRFTHAFFRQTLYEELSAPRRIRMHQQVARALEANYGRRLEEHAAELAEHYSNSSDAADLSKAVLYGELAARRAIAVFDYGEAVRLLEKTIDVQEVLDPDDKAKRCDLLLELSEALMPAGGWGKVIGTLGPEAFAIAESTGHPGRASRTCRIVRQALQREGGGATEGTPTSRLWAERGDRLAEPGTLDRVWADIALAREARVRFKVEEYGLHSRRALALSQQLGDADSMIAALSGIHLLAFISPRLLDEIGDLLPLFREKLDADLIGVSLAAKANLYLGCFRLLLLNGERDLAQHAFQKAQELATRTNDPLALAMVASMNRRVRFLDGALVELVEESHLPEELGFNEGDRVATATVAWFYTNGPRPPEPVIRAESDLALANYLLSHSRWNLISGNQTEAVEEFRRVVEDGTGSTKRFAYLTLTLDFAIRLGNDELVRDFYERAKSIPSMPGVITASLPLVLPTVMGDAAVYLGLVPEARQHYEEGLEVSLRVRHKPFVALTRLALAELLLAHYPDERAAAIEHLDFAIAELRDMKMQPPLERALRHRGLLKA